VIIKRIERGKMSTPDEFIQELAKADKPAKISPDKAGKFSISAAVVGIIINFAGGTLFKEGTAEAIMAGIVAGVAIAVGVAAAMWGLARAWRCPGKDAMILAGTGFVVNGILILIGFVTLPIPGKVDVGPKNVSAKEISVSPVSAKGGRLIVQDWTAGNTIEVTDKNFDDVVNNSNMPVLVDFWAPWCGPCRAMGPVIKQIAVKYQGKVKVCKLNVDIGTETASSFQIRGIPTIILFKKGRVVRTWTGVTDEREISSVIEKLL
jgi:thioredoxin 1